MFALDEGQCLANTPATLPPGKESPVPTEQEVRWVSETVWTGVGVWYKHKKQCFNKRRRKVIENGKKKETH
jgi:hypothetical protein